MDTGPFKKGLFHVHNFFHEAEVSSTLQVAEI